MKSIKLKESLKALLDTAEITAYEYTRVPKNATFPYATYNLITPTDSLRDAITDLDYSLEIDIMDYREDLNTDVLEGKTDEMLSIVNRKEVIETEFYYRIDNLTVLTQLPTPNENTFRRQIAGTLHYMERSTT